MITRRLGNSGLSVSLAGLGCNMLGATVPAEDVPALIGAALDAGITFFDTADVYGNPAGASEELLGAALGSRRADVVVASKFGMDMRGANGPDWGARGSRRYVMRAVEASLRRLGTDWIDLYQLHAPDPETPVQETLSALDDLVREGKIRYVGVSNVAGWQLADAVWTAEQGGLAPVVSVQNRWSLLAREVEQEVVPAAGHFGVGLLPYTPLASGLLTGKYVGGKAEAVFSASGTQITFRGFLAAYEEGRDVERYSEEDAPAGKGGPGGSVTVTLAPLGT